jgi:NADH-quinone oxidoreductase subunit J
MDEALFFICGTGAITGALGVVLLRNAFYSVLSLVFHLLCLAVLFLLLNAFFLAAAQVIVYAGAVMVLYVFVVAYVGGSDQPLVAPRGPLRILAPIFAGALGVELVIALGASAVAGLDTNGPGVRPDFGNAGYIGQLLLTKFLLPFEVASFLLLITAVGAVVMARRRRGLGADEAGPTPRGVSLGEIAARPLTGTMAEAVGGPGARPAEAATTRPRHDAAVGTSTEEPPAPARDEVGTSTEERPGHAGDEVGTGAEGARRRGS